MRIEGRCINGWRKNESHKAATGMNLTDGKSKRKKGTAKEWRVSARFLGEEKTSRKLRADWGEEWAERWRRGREEEIWATAKRGWGNRGNSGRERGETRRKGAAKQRGKDWVFEGWEKTRKERKQGEDREEEELQVAGQRFFTISTILLGLFHVKTLAGIEVIHLCLWVLAKLSFYLQDLVMVVWEFAAF